MGRNNPGAKTKTVLKSLREGEQLGNMPNKVFSIFNKNRPTACLGKRDQVRVLVKKKISYSCEPD